LETKEKMSQLTITPINPNTQMGKILSHLESGKTLTSLEALNKFGCLRLSGRIMELRDMDYRIHSEMITVNGKRIAQYSLVV
jgi:cbb3-type cytochrome oxidase cytochrome c subunit